MKAALSVARASISIGLQIRSGLDNVLNILVMSVDESLRCSYLEYAPHLTRLSWMLPLGQELRLDLAELGISGLEDNKLGCCVV